MHFGENQLSPSLIGLSPLPTAHPPGFQPWWVRSSTRSYPRFNLAMGRSLGFGSRARDCNRPVRTRFRYGYPPLPAGQHCRAAPPPPPPHPLPGITWKRFSLLRFRSPLLTESRLFSLPVGTEMFHFPTFPPHALCVQARVTPHDWCGVPPFGHPRINARLTAPRGLSQPPTSFIGSWCPGIHRVPLTTWPHKKPHPSLPRKGTTTGGPTRTPVTESEDARVHCAVLNDQPESPVTRP